ncbi:D-glycerate dehydrogenase [Bacillus sp. FJAT-29790]|uniref:2-hydroxyacid dehydrogenase n=1 Tax=Bacillus sp. FJAT-29790 TaxID=1895002 RepID=UPI001C21FB0B|nr:D-glycerate dehydrogenase [Bacillus sp. FJAT-29790]MBU8880355.1 D-glycerate dehydrogenase [Bacillus sp. FJAT-29790]
MRPKVYITMPIPEEVKKYISEYCEIGQWAEEIPIPRHVLFQELAKVEGLLTTSSSGGEINADLLDHAPHLKVVSNVSVGYNNFDLEAMKIRKVVGTHTPYVLDETVADLAFSLILATARRIPELDRFVKEGNWSPNNDDQDFYGIDVHSSTLGIIGMGRIGEKIARRAKFGFNMDVLYHNRNRNPEAEQKFDVEYCDMESLLKRSDYVVLMTPLTSETFELIGTKEFQQMKKSAIFINISRGKTVDEEALIRALQEKEIYGAGLDVFYNEPVEKDNPLLKMPNVVTVPHIGSATAKTSFDMAMRAAENLVAVVTGKKPIYPVPY